MPPKARTTNRSEEAAAWFGAVCAAAQQIPHGKVTSYGHLAYLVGHPERPRQVGMVMKHLPNTGEGEPFYHNENVPWQRVINSKGTISPRGPGSAQRQATRLRQEGVEVTRGDLGEFCIDFKVFGWFPSELPGEELSDTDDEESQGIRTDP